ncbi:hypothetical protein BW727_100750 [Jeotgalibaca dankookensis]|uniref:Steroid 5-alpha reductase C-terminal domain-containing protein n=2 Tax=Jeotgalibaca dankookensis TaxID=708126 RepID=A0A1S6INK9_9LACT|nr:hypothetical protein BW727_100750 [Jeotgalibaca dankookensis]
MISRLNFIFIIITILWLGEFLLFPSLDKDIKSEQKTYSVIFIAIIAIILLNASMFFMSILIIDCFLFRILGLIIYFMGLVLRYWSLILLGKNFSRNVEVRMDQTLIIRGSYKYLRHPLYIGLFLLTVAVPLYTGDLLIFLVAVILMYHVLRIRIKEEEDFMEEYLGERYVKWKKDRY